MTSTGPKFILKLKLALKVQVKVRNKGRFSKIIFFEKTARPKILKKFTQVELSKTQLFVQGKVDLLLIFGFTDPQSSNFGRSSRPHFQRNSPKFLPKVCFYKLY